MANTIPPPPPNYPAQQPSSSSAGKWLMGCGIGCLSLILLMIVGIGASVWWVKSYVEKNSEPFLKLGYERKAGQMMEVTEPVSKPTLFVGQMVNLKTNTTADVAIIAQMAEVEGKIGGKLSFRGQILAINPGTEISGDLDVQAQALQNQGTVRGKITGQFQEITGQDIKLPRLK